MLSYDDIEAFRDDPAEPQETRPKRAPRNATPMDAGAEMLSLTTRAHAAVLRGLLTARL